MPRSINIPLPPLSCSAFSVSRFCAGKAHAQSARHIVSYTLAGPAAACPFTFVPASLSFIGRIIGGHAQTVRGTPAQFYRNERATRLGKPPTRMNTHDFTAQEKRRRQRVICVIIRGRLRRRITSTYLCFSAAGFDQFNDWLLFMTNTPSSPLT